MSGKPAPAPGRPGRSPSSRSSDSRTRLLDAALQVIRSKGYSATRVEDVCEAAGLTKGAFFHHFTSKEALAVAAAEYWSATTGAFFANAAYHGYEDPLDRVLGYVEFRRRILRGRLPEFTCLAGTMVQETYETNAAIRDACAASITGHAVTLVEDIEAARRRHAPDGDWSAESLALFTQAVIQGAFILAKATGGPRLADESLAHLDRYLRLLFHQATDHPEHPEAIANTSRNLIQNASRNPIPNASQNPFPKTKPDKKPDAKTDKTRNMNPQTKTNEHKKE